MANLRQWWPDEYGLGRWFMFDEEGPTPRGVEPLDTPLKKGNFVNVYKAEMKFTWLEDPVPPEQEPTLCQGSWEWWFPKRTEALHAIHDKEQEMLTENDSVKIKAARIYKVQAKVTPQIDVLIALLNKQGIKGTATVCWQKLEDEGQDVMIGGGGGGD